MTQPPKITPAKKNRIMSNRNIKRLLKKIQRLFDVRYLILPDGVYGIAVYHILEKSTIRSHVDIFLYINRASMMTSNDKSNPLSKENSET